MKLLRRNLQSTFIHFSEYEFGKLTASSGRHLHGQENNDAQAEMYEGLSRNNDIYSLHFL